MTTALPALPVTVIGGYLGAGKTTLLNQALRDNHGLRIAVLVNDFGSINIDAELIESRDGDTISLANGCICCSLQVGFAQAMEALRARDPLPDLVVVEASGVADPRKIADYGHLPGFALAGVIVLVDVETIRRQAKDRLLGGTILRQLRGADLLMLTKTDLVAPAAVDQVRAWLAAVAPRAAFVVADRERTPLAILFGEGFGGGAPRDDGDPGEIDHPDYDTAALRTVRPLSRERFRAAVDALPAGTLRGKGIIWFEDDPGRRQVFQLVGRRWSVVPGAPWGETPPRSEVVLIGLPGSLAGSPLADIGMADG